MTFKHKLSRRLALLKDVAVLTAAVVAACEKPVLTSSTGLGGTVSQVVVVPKTVTLQASQTVDLMAVGFTSAGDTASISVSWTATGGSFVDTTSTGGRHYALYKAAVNTGTYKVFAHTDPGAYADSAIVTVSNVPVASVVVTPSSAALVVGALVQLTATPRDSAGNALAGRVVSWATSAASVATVNGSGGVTGVGAGAATITATSEGKSGTAAVTVSVPPPGTHVGYYVTPGGSSSGSGSSSQPWDLVTALNGGNGKLQPGDTVWLRSGTYAGSFYSNLNGSAAGNIIFRQYPGEHATIDGNLNVEGSYLTFWGFEIMQSNPVANGWKGLRAATSYGRFINLIIHDAGEMGVSFWTPGVNAELYGCIIYNNGTHTNLDHGIYVHNETGTKQMWDNVVFNNLAYGIHVYAEATYPVLTNVHMEGNVSFNNGTISTSYPAKGNLLVRAYTPTSGMVVTGNMLYYSGSDGMNLRLGDASSPTVNNLDVAAQGNYVVGGATAAWVELWNQATIKNNTVIGPSYMVYLAGSPLTGFQWDGNGYFRAATAAAWQYNGTSYDLAGWKQATGLGPNDQLLGTTPSQTQVFVRPNKYEAGRAHIVVYNWGHQGSVAVDVSTVLRSGDHYEVRNVQAAFGPPVVSGTYQGGTIAIPMGGVAPPTPIGRATATPPTTGPNFDVFLLTTSSPWP